ncbi:MAG: chorismate--pyruvate lyase [Gammaproteobacteria bacterium]|nr:MAG: chorismate--pyruvate lyase [Gammaproteobacteria bacterium]
MNLQTLFPVTLSSYWCDASTCTLSEQLQSWLLDPNSLTARLKSHCQQFRVELLGQWVESCQADEAVTLIPCGEQVLVREVLLFCDEKPHVFARSLLPLSSLTGAEQALANLGTQSLGQVLFNNPSLERQTIAVAEFDENSTVGKLVEQLKLSMLPHGKLWGRRSVFILENKPLMVAEVFLPDAIAYQQIVDTEYTNV